jgi:hypothetical protein
MMTRGLGSSAKIGHPIILAFLALFFIYKQFYPNVYHLLTIKLPFCNQSLLTISIGTFADDKHGKKAANFLVKTLNKINDKQQYILTLYIYQCFV